MGTKAAAAAQLEAETVVWEAAVAAFQEEEAGVALETALRRRWRQRTPRSDLNLV